jgi:hypothetical protein
VTLPQGAGVREGLRYRQDYGEPQEAGGTTLIRHCQAILLDRPALLLDLNQRLVGPVLRDHEG